MIDLNQKQRIILAHLDGASNREIARQMHMSKDTVNKYVREYDEKRAELLAMYPDMEQLEIIQAFVEKPKYDSRSRGPQKKTEDALQVIRECLALNEERRSKGLHKQQMKKIDIYEHLTRLGYDTSYSTVKRLIRKLEKTAAEAYIRQEYSYGDISEFDWGTVKLDIGGGGYKKYQMAVFTAAKTNYRFAKLYHSQDTPAFQESHADYFAHCHGVFHTMVYDNMKVAVRRFVGPQEKEPTEALSQLSLYYGFHFRFCNIRSGNEKGHVERSVEYVRRKVFCGPGNDIFDSLAEANLFLYRECMKLNARKIYDGSVPAEAFPLEREHLHPEPPRFESCRRTTGNVDKYSTVMIAQNHYSVPDHLVGKKVDIRLYTDRIHIYYEGEQVARHARSFRGHDWKIDIYHYLHTLKKKPGALRQSSALLQADTRIKEIYETYYSSDAKTFLEVLEIIYEKGIEKVGMALCRLEVLSPGDLSADKVKVICDTTDEEESENLRPGTDRLSRKSKSTLEQYDKLRRLQNHGERMVV